MAKLNNFTKDDMFAFQGAEVFADGSLPRIYHFSNEELTSLFDLMGVHYDECDSAWILHHGDGMTLGVCVGGDVHEVEWESGEDSKNVEALVERMDSTTLPLWAATSLSIRKYS